jgi:hypothetical protein
MLDIAGLDVLRARRGNKERERKLSNLTEKKKERIKTANLPTKNFFRMKFLDNSPIKSALICAFFVSSFIYLFYFKLFIFPVWPHLRLGVLAPLYILNKHLCGFSNIKLASNQKASQLAKAYLLYKFGVQLLQL